MLLITIVTFSRGKDSADDRADVNIGIESYHRSVFV